MKKVSIIIPVYNGEKYVSQAIESALNQTYSNIEIIVVNDGSKDRTEEIVLKYKDKINYINKENGGVASALNAGIEASTGDYISWLSHDDLYKNNKIEIMMNCLSKLDNKKTILFCNVEFINYKNQIIGKTDYLNTVGKKLINKGIYPILKGATNGCAMLIPKDCFKEVGLFDLKLLTTADYDMWIRLFSKYDSFFIPDYLIQYRLHSKQDTNKHPEYIKECDALWTNIINNITIKMIKDWKEHPANIYMDLYYQMKSSGFNNAAKSAYALAEKHKGSVIETSIIMPSYNTEKYIEEAITSIIDQKYSTFELIIVDDGSTDNTYNIAKKYLKKDCRIRLIKNTCEKGVAGAMNSGILAAKGKYLGRQDSDDISAVDRLKQQIDFLESNYEYNYCAVDINLMNAKGKVYSSNVYSDTPNALEYSYCFGNSIPNATIVYKMDIIKKYKLLFNNIVVSEDFNFLLRYCQHGKGYLIKSSLYNYRIINGLYNSNIDLARKYGLQYSLEYCKKITSIDIPEFINDFSDNKRKIENDEVEKIRSMLINISKPFIEKYEYDQDTIESINRYNNNKIQIMSGDKNYKKNIKKEEKLIKKVFVSIQTRGIKETIKKIINKIKS